MSIQLKVPDIGDFEQVEIIEVIVKAGESIKKNDPVVTLESDKSSVEVPSTVEGKISNINVKVGDKVSKGDLILEVEGNGKVSPDEIPKSTKNLIEEAEKTIHKEIKHAQETEIQKEIKEYGADLKEKECITVLTKTDALLDELNDEIEHNLKKAGVTEVIRISSITGKGLKSLLGKVSKIIVNYDKSETNISHVH